MNILNIGSVFLLLALSSYGYCETVPEGRPHFGQAGERPSEAQIAEWKAKRAAAQAQAGSEGSSGRPDEAQIADWKAKRAAQGGGNASPAGGANAHESQHGAGAGNGAMVGMPGMSGKPDGTRPGGMPMGMRGSVLWLSDTPPMRGDGARGGGMSAMGGMEMGGGRGGIPQKRLWLRSGNDPQRSGFAQNDPAAQIETLLVTPDSKPEGEVLSVAGEERKGVSFEMPKQGFYRLYLTSRKLQGETLNINVAKAEITNIGHGGDEEEIAKALVAPRVLESAAIEIVRERKPDEKRFFQLKSGEEQAYIVLQKGLPLQGARVRFVSHQGWVKEAMSDEQGRVSFQIVRDYFPLWNEFQKRFKATYLVIAEANAAEVGKFNEQPYSNVKYQASLAGNYYPSPEDYLSYAWGLGIGLFITLFCGVAVYLYRRRRVKPFQEVRPDVNQ